MSKRKVPDTSREAWESITQEQLNSHHAKILSSLVGIFLSAEQIAARTDLTHHQINRRMKELEKKELVYRNGGRVSTATGRSAFTWGLCKPGQIPEKITEKTLPGKSISEYSKEIKKYSQTDLFGK